MTFGIVHIPLEHLTHSKSKSIHNDIQLMSHCLYEPKVSKIGNLQNYQRTFHFFQRGNYDTDYSKLAFVFEMIFLSFQGLKCPKLS